MPPRHAYWTILVDDQPTAFRAHDPEELLATLNRLKEKHPSAVMKWFERGKLWDSRDAARAEGLGQGERRWEGPRPDRAGEPERERSRDRSWRPGGEHRDPRQKYKDAKKAKWDRFKKNIHDRAARRDAGGSPTDPREISPPHGDPLRDKLEPPPRRERAGRPPDRPERRDVRPSGGEDRRQGWTPKAPPRAPAGWKPKGPPRDDRGDRDERRDRPQYGDRRDRPQYGDRPPQSRDRRGDRPRDERDRGGWQGRDRPGGDWRDRPPRDADRRGGERDVTPRGPRQAGEREPSGPRQPGARKPWGAKAGGFGAKKPYAPKKTWGAKKSWGAKPTGRGGPRPGGNGPRGGKGPRGPRKPRGE
jgi:23S rRNA pseudouridine2605 synthase